MAAGGSCEGWEPEASLAMYALESGSCTGDDALAIYEIGPNTDSDIAAEAAFLSKMNAGLEALGTQQAFSIIYGPNWLVSAANAAALANTLGGTVFTPEPEDPTPSAEPETATDFVKLSERDWKRLVKDPDAHVGEAFVVYGVITQFDAATGSNGFRADSGPTKHSDRYEYSENSVFIGDADKLADLVEDDIFMAKVTVGGAYEYETTMGGSMTVPQFDIVLIKRIG